MTRLKAILKVLFHVARRSSTSGEPAYLRVSSGGMSDLEALLADDHTPEQERGEW